MDFQYLIAQLSKLKVAPLGGLASQYKMVPELRKKHSLTHIKNQQPKASAVLALLYPDANYKTNILLMLRASYQGTHSAQISFPGGKKDKMDSNLQDTALRETQEEVGILKDDISILRKLTKTYIPPSNFWVTPYLGICNNTPTFKTNHEVEKLIEVSLIDLLDDTRLSSKIMSTTYMENIEVPYFKLNNYTVWGATAMMLSEIKDLLKVLV